MLADVLAKSGEAVKSGPIGLAVILVLCIGCYFLFKSMSKHLRTVREKFPTDADVPSPGRSVQQVAVPGDAAGRASGQPPAERPAEPAAE